MLMNLETLRMHYKPAIMEALQHYNLYSVKVFGSVARGDADATSDLDLLIQTGKGLGLQIVSLEQRLGEIVGMPVQLLTENGLNPLIRDRILHEATPL